MALENQPEISDKDIIEDLLGISVCKRCCLRALNEKNLDSYKNAETVINKLLGKPELNNCENSSKLRKLNPCLVCLGLLQPDVINEITDKIVDEVLTSNYDCDHMTCAISLPIIFQLRNHSLWLYLFSKYEKYYVNRYASYLPDNLKHENVIASVKEVWKLLTASILSQRVKKILTNDTNRYFFVNINVAYDNDEKETSCLIEMQPSMFKDRPSQKRKYHGEVLTRKSVEIVLSNFTDIKEFEKFYPVPPDIPESFVKCTSVQCCHDSIYLAGRYNKFSRSLSQTPWIVNGERKMETSVQDIIMEPVHKIIPNDGIVFIGSGREDVDVRTLGKGRPFVIEVTNPKKTKLKFQDLRKLENEINLSTKDIFIRDLQLVRKNELHNIKQGEESKTKTYTCYCVIHSEKPKTDIIQKINDLKNMQPFVLNQKTPIRVLHRRTLSIREKTVYWLKPTICDSESNTLYFKLMLKVQAGTYIKEFIHGDFGRTKPNLSSILGEAVDILALDVEEVHLDWPPSLEVFNV